MGITETKECFEIMQAFIDGKQIQWYDSDNDKWITTISPAWDWSEHTYRVKPEPEWVPYENPEEMFETAVKNKFSVIVKDTKHHCSVYISELFISYDDRFRDFAHAFYDLWWEDGTPFGKQLKD